MLQLAGEPDTALARHHIGLALDAAATLGRRTAELHLALAPPTADPAFAPEPLTPGDLDRLAIGAARSRRRRVRRAEGRPRVAAR